MNECLFTASSATNNEGGASVATKGIHSRGDRRRGNRNRGDRRRGNRNRGDRRRGNRNRGSGDGGTGTGGTGDGGTGTGGTGTGGTGTGGDGGTGTGGTGDGGTGTGGTGTGGTGTGGTGDGGTGDGGTGTRGTGDGGTGVRENRKNTLSKISETKRTFLNIPIRHLTTQEWMEQLLLAQAKENFLDGKPITVDSLKDTVQVDTAPKDPLDKVRIAATLLMVVALFAIVAVVVFKPTTPPGIYQLISLASGLAGIGLGWLFGAATTTRSKKKP